MLNLLKISEAASLGLHASVFLAGNQKRLFSAKEMAETLGASEAHLAKVLQRLAREGLVRSQRGPKGGFKLNRPADEITLLEVYQACEGPLPQSNCLLSTPICNGNCILGNLIEDVGRRVSQYLSRTKLSDLGGSFACARSASEQPSCAAGSAP